jgi:hypothetical protein
MTHPNVRTKQPRAVGDVLRAMVYAPTPAVAEWIETELASRRATYQLGRSIEQIVAGLTEDPPPRATVLVADFDAMAPVDVLRIHAIREQGWFGVVIGLGRVPVSLLASLGIDRVIQPPYRQGMLADAVSEAGIMRATTRIAVVERPGRP